MKNYALGIDTSNYKTSVALVDRDGNIFYDDRIFLSVKKGELGLRQNEAVFQHTGNLPRLLEEALGYIDPLEIAVVSVSDKPRDLKDSYMPCFMSGLSQAKVLASALRVPLIRCSHQRGHIEAGKRFTALNNQKEFIAFHFSGGTTEGLLVSEDQIKIIGGTKDISFGQLLDRTGVAMGYPFPAGEDMDNGAIRHASGKTIYEDGNRIKDFDTETDINLPKSKLESSFINLSGLETASINLIESFEGKMDEDLRDRFSYALLKEVGRMILHLMSASSQAAKEITGKDIKEFLFVGGVSSSSFLRDYIEKEGQARGMGVYFASPELASDNAVGVAFIGGDQVWP